MVDLIRWWYFRGWATFWSGFKIRLSDTADFFSISDMLRTLFKPYRQISANAASDALEAKMGAFFDRLISRLVGFFARTVIIISGAIVLLIELILGLIMMVIWPVVPCLPILGIVLAVVGVTF